VRLREGMSMKFLEGLLGSKGLETESFEDLLEAHLDGMYRVGLSLTRNSIQAEDLVQDTVLRALRFKHRFEMGTHFRAWIYKVLHNTFIQNYRRSKRERDVLSGSGQQDVAEHMACEATRLQCEQPEESYLNSLLSDEVLQALEALPEDFRLVVTLCDIEGLSYREIAEILDCPAGTVMSRLYRARRQLRGALMKVAYDKGIIKSPVLVGDRVKKGNSDAGADVLELAKRLPRKERQSWS
jgi:RNA polymerase sigma-70 factor, ECF subfamily